MSTIQVRVKLCSRFREHLPTEARGEAPVEMAEDATVGDLLAHLGITRRVQLIAINDEPETDRARILKDGDSVRVLPFVVGG